MTTGTQIIPIRLTIHPSNTIENPVASKYIQVFRGYIAREVWQFPTGCKGRVHVVLESREDRLSPSQGDMALGGGPPVVFDGLRIPVPDNDPALRLVGWVDEGASEATTIDVYVQLEPAGGA